MRHSRRCPAKHQIKRAEISGHGNGVLDPDVPTTACRKGPIASDHLELRRVPQPGRAKEQTAAVSKPNDRCEARKLKVCDRLPLTAFDSPNLGRRPSQRSGNFRLGRATCPSRHGQLLAKLDRVAVRAADGFVQWPNPIRHAAKCPERPLPAGYRCLTAAQRRQLSPDGDHILPRSPRRPVFVAQRPNPGARTARAPAGASLG